MIPARLPLLFVMCAICLPVCGGLSVLKNCPCDDANLCRSLKEETKNTNHKVYAFSAGATNIENWKWETITTFVAPSTFNMNNKSEAQTMCIAHQHGRKFGITVDMDLSGSLNSSSLKAQNWIDSAILSQANWNADVINVNLLPYFTSDHDSERDDHIELVHIIHKLHLELKKILDTTGATVEISCVIPWKPPCASKEASCIFSHVIVDTCDFFVLNPDSFLDVEDEKCRASATIPFSKLIYGISEYNAHFLPSSRIILGVTWHGYDYTCSDMTSDVCTLKTITIENSTVTKCDFSNKKRLTYSNIVSGHSIERHDHKKSELYNAPYFNYKNGPVNHQVWFEDHYSLAGKYNLIKELSLAGVGIFYGDDFVQSSKLLTSDGLLWSWVAHEFLLAKSRSSSKNNLHCADTVAGVAVGCLLLGCLMGIAFTCLIFHKKIRKPKRPFVRDADPDADDYTDEDPNL